MNRFMRLALGFVTIWVSTVSAQPTADSPSAWLEYAKPGALVRLADGRAMHLRCVGTGSPTVILLAGLGEWSATWRLVQPDLAKLTRTCSWDRAGLGFSEGSLLPQTLRQLTTDLADTLKAAGVEGPYVMVGHSYGGLESLAFWDRHAGEVAGMVLVDPSTPGQDRVMRAAAPHTMAAGDRFYAALVQQFQGCRALAENDQLKPGLPGADECIGPFVSEQPQALADVMIPLQNDAPRWEARASLFKSVMEGEAFSAMVQPDRRLGPLPLVVLSASEMALPPDATPEEVAEVPAGMREWHAMHEALVGLSSRGVHRVVPKVSHYLHLQQPSVVVEAVSEMVLDWRNTSAGH